MELPTILIIANAVSSAQEAAELCAQHTQDDTTANYHFAKAHGHLTWKVFDPQKTTTTQVKVTGLANYDMLVVIDRDEFETLSHQKIGAGAKLKMPIIWTGTHIHQDEWERFEAWIKKPDALAAMHAARDFRPSTTE